MTDKTWARRRKDPKYLAQVIYIALGALLLIALALGFGIAYAAGPALAVFSLFMMVLVILDAIVLGSALIRHFDATRPEPRPFERTTEP